MAFEKQPLLPVFIDWLHIVEDSHQSTQLGFLGPLEISLGIYLFRACVCEFLVKEACLCFFSLSLVSEILLFPWCYRILGFASALSGPLLGKQLCHQFSLAFSQETQNIPRGAPQTLWTYIPLLSFLLEGEAGPWSFLLIVLCQVWGWEEVRAGKMHPTFLCASVEFY